MTTATATYDETAIDTALVHIKDSLFSVASHLDHEANRMPAIRDEIEKVVDVCDKLELLRELWKALRYSYKGREIATLLSRAVQAWQANMAQSGVCHDAGLLQRTWDRCNALVEGYHGDERG